jgi:hypothetical protein
MAILGAVTIPFFESKLWENGSVAGVIPIAIGTAHLSANNIGDASTCLPTRKFAWACTFTKPKRYSSPCEIVAPMTYTTKPIVQSMKANADATVFALSIQLAILDFHGNFDL